MGSGDSAGGGSSLVGWAVRQVAIWGGLALAVYFAIGYHSLWLPSAWAPQPTQAPAVTEQQRPVPTNSLVYRANPQGHVIIDGVVNGAPMRFMLDTGATAVALTARDAAAAGIARYQLDFNKRVETANGVVRVAPVQLREVRLGQLSVDDVQAVVVDNLEISLLGQSFLTRLQSYEMRDGALTITW